MRPLPLPSWARRDRAGRVLAAGLLTTLLVGTGCGRGVPQPATPDPRHDLCRFCRMSVLDVRFAAQIVAPGEEPVFFDDLECLTNYLRGGGTLLPDAVIYVGDYQHRTWILAEQAVYTRVKGLDTPMGSGLIAHRDAAARDTDPVARTGEPVPTTTVVPVERSGRTR